MSFRSIKNDELPRGTKKHYVVQVRRKRVFTQSQRDRTEKEPGLDWDQNLALEGA